MSEHLAVIAAVIYGVILTPFAILGIAAQVRRARARRAPPPTRAWALFDVPTIIRRRASGGDNPE
jgi:hypothetical protein